MSAETVRAFFAVELSESARAEAERAAQEMRKALEEEAVRWTPPEGMHLTLKFLGDVRSDAIPRLVARAAARLAPLDGFDVALGGLGAFPNARQARVLWIGVSRGGSELARLARKLEAAARGLGVPRERRPFHAHLTLGRLRRPGRVPLERLAGPDSVAFPVDEVVLYESRLSSSGATYVPLARLPLAAEGDRSVEFAPEL